MIISRTPFRLPLGGGGTDLPSYYKEHGGFLITAALNLHMHLCINEPAMVNKIKLNYSNTEVVELDEINSIKHEIVRETLKYLKVVRPLEISSMSDIAGGTGLGSSSSYTVGLLNALNTLLRRHVSVHELAEEAARIEMELIGKPIGKQDQYAAAFGGIVALDIDRSGDVQVTRLKLEPEFITELENRLLLFYTKIQRDANEILSDQQKIISKKNASLDSMHNIKRIGYQIKDALCCGDVDSFGELLYKHWLEKKRVSDKMSSSQIDQWYELALKNGAIGGKIMGAGGGGFFVFCCQAGKRRELRTALESAGLKYQRCSFDFEGSKIVGNF
ncbi:MAG: galactokinase [Verrucomicrobia bacterium]|nr:galactokinase [Verrucomicrobiota bacterium]